jgi:hypothetical protein
MDRLFSDHTPAHRAFSADNIRLDDSSTDVISELPISAIRVYYEYADGIYERAFTL